MPFGSFIRTRRARLLTAYIIAENDVVDETVHGLDI